MGALRPKRQRQPGLTRAAAPFLALVTLLAGAPWECAGSNPAYETGAMNCELRPDSPHVSAHAQQRHGQKWINAVIAYRCRLPVEGHHLVGSVERRVGERWLVMRADATDKLPDPGGKSQQVRGHLHGLSHSGPQFIRC